ncbi:hypothetical protein L1887_02897 [Cichorium endivia]|nr:hypothetical protein L1887_02897 [Cichorium endivia]
MSELLNKEACGGFIRFHRRPACWPASRATVEANKATTCLLIQELRHGSVSGKAMAAREIRVLAKTGRENRAFIVESGAIPCLKNVLFSQSIVAHENAVTTILNLSVYDNNKSLIMEEDEFGPSPFPMETLISDPPIPSSLPPFDTGLRSESHVPDNPEPISTSLDLNRMANFDTTNKDIPEQSESDCASSSLEANRIISVGKAIGFEIEDGDPVLMEAIGEKGEKMLPNELVIIERKRNR